MPACLAAIFATAFRNCGDCPEMVVIPAGRFMMGSTEAESKRDAAPEDGAWEQPRHDVAVASFALGKYLLTKGEFAQFVRETGYHQGGCTSYNSARHGPEPLNSWSSPGFAQSDRDPVVCLSYADAQGYLAWLNGKISGKKTGDGPYRLPSEAEWEYAARAGTTTARYWNDAAGQVCDYANGADLSFKDKYPSESAVADCRDGFVHTSPVGNFLSNRFGLFDMLGNVRQWTEDCWTPGYAGAPADGRARTDGDCRMRAVRGAAWYNRPGELRAAIRIAGNAAHGNYDDTGLRIAKTLR